MGLTPRDSATAARALLDADAITPLEAHVALRGLQKDIFLGADVVQDENRKDQPRGREDDEQDADNVERIEGDEEFDWSDEEMDQDKVEQEEEDDEEEEDKEEEEEE